MKFLLLLLFFMEPLIAKEKQILRVGSKPFTENYILAEIISQIIEDENEVIVERKFGLGGSGIVFKALTEREIDIYPAYTGTISQAILKNKELLSLASIQKELRDMHKIEMSPTIGFNNTYVLALKNGLSESLGVHTISDLKKHQDLKSGFTHEFIKRKDGLEALQRFYGFKLTEAQGMEHGLAYQAIGEGSIDLMEVYSTDAKILKYKLDLLEDNLNFFTEYLSVFLTHADFKLRFPRSYEALEEKLLGKIDAKKMTYLNALVELEGRSFSYAAKDFLEKKQKGQYSSIIKRVTKLSIEHLKLVFVGLFFSILIGLPLGILASQSKILGQITLMGSGLLQTIPSLALLCFLIPVFGIGENPAYVALFLYGLLPIVRNTYSGLKQINHDLIESSEILGLTYWEKLIKIQLPLASINILNGIRTSAIINVGTATLAAFIGAGGLGTLIVTGLSLNSNEVILRGAIPAAFLAGLMHLLFEGLDRLLIPKGIRP